MFDIQLSVPRVNEKMPRKFEAVVDDVLTKYAFTKFRKGYLKTEDFVVTEYFQNFSDDLENFTISSSDTWVCSFPKTGKVF